MAIRLITVISMTDLNNSNADEERPNAAPNGGEGASSNADDLDAAWAEFASSHADDLQAVEHSRSAKRFEKHAQRREKEALLSIQDLDQGTFTDDTPQGRGPRDFTGSSWLDTDSVMDRYGDDFTPTNPSIGHVKISKLVFWVLLIAGVAGTYKARVSSLSVLTRHALYVLMICYFAEYQAFLDWAAVIHWSSSAEALPESTVSSAMA